MLDDPHNSLRPDRDSFSILSLFPANYFCSGADGVEVVSATFSAPPVDKRVRKGKKGVISNSIFSRAEFRATALALESST